MMTFQRKLSLVFIVLIVIFSMIVGAISAQTMTDTRTYEVPQSGYAFEYPLDHYSVRYACGCSGSLDVLFPGMITIQPNDSLIFRDGTDTIYRITIAAWRAPEGTVLDEALFGTGVLMQYVPDMVDPANIQSIQLGGVDALRLDGLAVGQGGNGSDIFALNDGILYEITLEAVAGNAVDGEPDPNRISGDELVEQILSSFQFSAITE